MSREAFEAWKKQHGIAFVSRSYGEQTTHTVSREALMALWQAAMQHAYADAAYLCDQMFNRAADADECADAIRERAKEVGK
jgi:hypothetical protein